MFGFNYENFKAALLKAEQDRHELLERDIAKVKAFVEKALTLCLESNANLARTSYPGVEL